MVRLGDQVPLDHQDPLVLEETLEQEVMLDHQGNQVPVDHLGRQDQEVTLVLLGTPEDLAELEALVHRGQRVILGLRVQLVVQDLKETEAAQVLQGLLVLREQGVI